MFCAANKSFFFFFTSYECYSLLSEYIKDKAQFHSGTLLATGIISVICIFVSMQHVPEGLKAPLKIYAVDWLSGDWLCIWAWSPTFSGRTIYKEDMAFEFTDKCSVIVPLCLNIQSVSYRWSGMGNLLSYALGAKRAILMTLTAGLF